MAMSENQSKNNQWFRWGFVCILVVGAAVWYFRSAPVGKDGPQVEETPTVSEKLRTEDRAKKIGQTLIEKNFELTRFVVVSQKRNVASAEEGNVEAVTGKVTEGEYGRDSWGHPFYFKVIDGKVFIWSKGENHELDSSMDQLLSNNAAGDDVVVSLSL